VIWHPYWLIGASKGISTGIFAKECFDLLAERRIKASGSQHCGSLTRRRRSQRIEKLFDSLPLLWIHLHPAKP
jgi:hypothetical protein